MSATRCALCGQEGKGFCGCGARNSRVRCQYEVSVRTYDVATGDEAFRGTVAVTPTKHEADAWAGNLRAVMLKAEAHTRVIVLVTEVES